MTDRLSYLLHQFKEVLQKATQLLVLNCSVVVLR